MTQRILSGNLLADYDAFDDLLTSVNTYADVGTWVTSFLITKRFRFAAATNNLLVKILGSLDGGATFPAEVLAETAVNVGTPVLPSAITTYWTALKVQVKPAVDDTHGTLSTQYAGGSF